MLILLFAANCCKEARASKLIVCEKRQLELGDRGRVVVIMSFDASQMRQLLSRAVQYLDSPRPQAHSSANSSMSPQTLVPAASSSSSSAQTLVPAASSSVAERNSLFNFRARPGRKGKGKGKKKMKSSMWCHDFICLARPDQDKTPSPLERSRLATAGELVCCICMLHAYACKVSCCNSVCNSIYWLVIFVLGF